MDGIRKSHKSSEKSDQNVCVNSSDILQVNQGSLADTYISMGPSSSPSGSIPVFKDVVLVGGGHANVHVIKMLGAMRPLPGVRVTLIAKDTMTPYSGMIPAYIAGVFSLSWNRLFAYFSR